MIKRLSSILILLALLTACRAAPAVLPPTDAASPVPPTLTNTATATAAPTATATALPSPTPAPTVTLRLHPEGGLFVGDQVSFEVILDPTLEGFENQDVRIELPTLQEPEVVEATVSRYGIGRRLQAVALWAWDTSSLPPGDYAVTVSLPNDAGAWPTTITLQAQADMPASEQGAAWATRRSECCEVRYVTGTEAERDIEQLLDTIDAQAEQAVQRMGAQLEEPISIVLLPRVLGHGGFAGQEISVSYLDRNYMGNSSAIVLHHEMIHILDAKLGGTYRPSALVEGLAVYHSGGHFKLEPLPERSAALLPPESGCQVWTAEAPAAAPAAEGCGVGEYIPLERLLNNFYFEQHEVGYLQAAGLVDYMIQTWGSQAFERFYRSISAPQDEQTPAEVIDAALQVHFSLNLAELETRFLAHLDAQTVSPAAAEDLRLSRRFFDTARAYQLQYDPSAHFLTAWLLDGAEMQRRNIVADYLRHPQEPVNIQLEQQLVAAFQALLAQDYAQVEALLDAVEMALAGE